MQLVLIDDVLHLGRRGDIVTVASGYGRNYLIPKGLAVPATSANRKIVEQQRAVLARKEARVKEDAEILAKEMNRLHLVLSRKAGETGALFGSVTAKDLADLLEQKGFNLERRRIDLEQPLKSIGNFPVSAHPHPEVSIELLVSIVVEGEEPLTQVLQRESEESAAVVGSVENLLREAEEELEAQRQALPPEVSEPAAAPPEDTVQQTLEKEPEDVPGDSAGESADG